MYSPSSKITLVELNVYDSWVPLVSGYLQAYSHTFPELKERFTFDLCPMNYRLPPEKILEQLVEREADIYGFSCYVWNMGLVKTLLPELLTRRPGAIVVLGGPQVMGHAHDYIAPHWENVLVCNGEGEKTFASLLHILAEGSRDFSAVRGVSFYRDGEIVTTEKEERFANLDDIPSPYLTGIFDNVTYVSMIETNRGCPFHCGFCVWGAATNDRVYQFSEERVFEEISWLAKKKVQTIIIADANWGMLQRDVRFSEHIADCRKRYNFPAGVRYNSAKNSPGRVKEISKAFASAGMLCAQPVSIQTLDETSLKLIERTNINQKDYETLQSELKALGVASFVELIWPLPGETLDSYKKGISALCRAKTQNITIYSQVLLHNSPLYEKQKELNLVTRRDENPTGEVNVVEETAQVDYQDYLDGISLRNAITALWNARALRAVSQYLDAARDVPYAELFSLFVEFCRNGGGGHFAEYSEHTFDRTKRSDIFLPGKLAHIIWGSHRDEFTDELHTFVSSQPWWDDWKVQFLFEIDLLNKPFLYNNLGFSLPQYDFKYVKVLSEEPNGCIVEIGEELLHLLKEIEDIPSQDVEGSSVFFIDHKREQFTFDEKRHPDANGAYCSGIIQNCNRILPFWRPLNAAHVSESPVLATEELSGSNEESPERAFQIF